MTGALRSEKSTVVLLRWWLPPENPGAVFRAVGILAIAAGILVFWTGLSDAYQLPKMLLFSVASLTLWMRRDWRTHETALDAPLTAFFVIMALSAIFSSEPITSVFGVYRAPFYGLLPVAIYASLYYSVSYAQTKPDLFLKAILAGVALNAGYASVQALGLDPFTSWGFAYGRASGFTAGPVYLGSLIVTIVPMSVYLFRKPKTVFPWALAWVIITGLYLTKSRGAWLGAASAAVAYMFITEKVGKKKIILVILSLSIAGAALLPGRVQADGLRMELWKIAVIAFREAPVLGTGPDTYTTSFRKYRTDRYMELHDDKNQQSSAHNDILQVLSTLGLAGLAAYGWILFTLIVSVNLLRRLDPELAGIVGGALFGVFVQAKFNPVPFVTISVLAVLVGVMSWRLRGALRDRRNSGTLVSACLTVVIFVSCLADMSFRDAINHARNKDAKASSLSLENAIALNPWNIEYQRKYVQLIHSIAGSVDQQSEFIFLRQALQISEDAVHRFPRSIQAYEILGTSRMLLRSRHGFGSFESAMVAFDEAQRLDPKFLHTMKLRQAIAKRMRDKDKFESIRRERQRLEKLMEAKHGMGSESRR